MSMNWLNPRGWRRIYPKDKHINDAMMTAIRYYGVNGKDYPMLYIGVLVDVHLKHSFKIGCGKKDQKKDQWKKCDIPNELSSELVGMLTDLTNVNLKERNFELGTNIP